MLSHRNCNNSFISLVQYIRKYYGDVINGLIIHTIGITLLLPLKAQRAGKNVIAHWLPHSVDLFPNDWLCCILIPDRLTKTVASNLITTT